MKSVYLQSERILLQYPAYAHSPEPNTEVNSTANVVFQEQQALFLSAVPG